MKNIGFVSTRFAGTDGVSLESEKWARMLEEERHEVFWFAGELDRDLQRSMLVPEAFFGHADNDRISREVWGKFRRSPEIYRMICDLSDFLKNKLYEFTERFKIDILIVENALTIPMHIPLGLAITNFLAETCTPTVAHHHDFYWERSRFLVSAARDLLDMCFPPSLPNIQHAVINTAARDELAWRKGLAAVIVPNVLDYENPPQFSEEKLAKTRKTMGIQRGDILILQPTRVVPRKGIEQAITVVARLKDPRCKLVISHESGDEGSVYIRALQELAGDSHVDLRFIETTIPRFFHGLYQPRENNTVSLWDVYPCADLVTYPSLYEGFGNAFLEAFYFKKPVLINRYTIWIQDIEPKGFQTISMDGYVTNELVEKVRHILNDEVARREMTEHNYKVATRYFSYAVLRRRLRSLIINVAGLG